LASGNSAPVAVAATRLNGPIAPWPSTSSQHPLIPASALQLAATRFLHDGWLMSINQLLKFERR
jgi:hypothetical protein